MPETTFTFSAVPIRARRASVNLVLSLGLGKALNSSSFKTRSASGGRSCRCSRPTSKDGCTVWGRHSLRTHGARF